MSLPGVETASQWGTEFTDEAVIWDTEVSEFESKADEVGEAGKDQHEKEWIEVIQICLQARSMDPAVYKDRSIDVWMGYWREEGGLSTRLGCDGGAFSKRARTSSETSWSSMLPM